MSEAKAIIIYASHTNGINELSTSLVHILDDKNRTMSRRSVEGENWYLVVFGARRDNASSSFLDFAFLNGLGAYIRVKALSSCPITGEQASQLLHRRLRESWWGTTGWILPLQKNMIFILLQLGADVNWKGIHTQSIFDLFVKRYVGVTLNSMRRQHDEFQIEINPFDAGTWSILARMSDEGADPSVSMEFDGSNMTFSQFVINYISPRLPSLAARIMTSWDKSDSTRKRRR